MLQDFRYALRQLAKHPGFTLAAVLTLALGLGASAAVYTVFERVVLDPLPYPEPGRLVRLKSAVPGVGTGEEWNLSEGEYFYFGSEAGTIEQLGAYARGGANILGPEGPERVRTTAVTAPMFALLGARPLHGRVTNAQDDVPGAPPVVVLSHGFWQRQFGGDPAVVGRTLSIDERPVEIIGVLAAGTQLPGEPGTPATVLGSDIWRPLTLNPAGPFWNSHWIQMIARLADGETIESAQAEFARLTARLPEAIPNAYSPQFMERYGFRTVMYPLKAYAVGEIASTLWIPLGAVGLVLLIACANVANLFLVRIEGRRREIAIRTALGAGKRALVRHFLAESLTVALMGGCIGLVLAYWGVAWLVSLAPATVPRLEGLVPDASVLAVTFVLALAAGLLLAVLPLLRHTPAAGAGELAEGGWGATVGRERQRVRAGLVVLQVALALVLVVGAGLLIQSFQRLRSVDPGVDPRGVMTMQLYLPFSRYPDHASTWSFYGAVLERINALPGVAAAGLSTTIPFRGGYGCTVQGFEDQAVYERAAGERETLCAGQEPTSPGYFEAMGIPLLQGRTFTAADNEDPSAGAVIVSKTFAERFWPGEDPIGKGVGPNGFTNQPFYRVVGVVGDVYSMSVDENPAVAIYYPIVRISETSGWSAPRVMYLTVRATAGIGPLVDAVRRAVAEVDPAIPLGNIEPMQAVLDRSMASVSFTMVLLAVAGGVALLLAAIGLYGVVAYTVARRTSEIGVRIALGAQPSQVRGQVVGGSLRLAVVGVTLGVLVALGLSRALQGLLFGVTATHPAAYLAAAAILTAVAVVAAWMPARRAARVDPMEALRYE